MKTKTDNSLWIGFNDKLDPDKLDGYVWVKNEKDGLTPRPFMASNPEALRVDDEKNISSIFDQVKKMGMLPFYIELFVNGIRKIFMHGVYDMPIYVDRI